MNLVDFDALWGHRRNPEGYGREIEKFDSGLGTLMNELREDDLLILTADHGNDQLIPEQIIQENMYHLLHIQRK